MAMAARDGWIPQPDLLTPAVRDMLARGFAETHLHVGASLDFRCVWSLLLARLASPGLRVADAGRAWCGAAGGLGPAGLAAALRHRPDAAGRLPVGGHRGRLRRVRPGIAGARPYRRASRRRRRSRSCSSPSPTWSRRPVAGRAALPAPGCLRGADRHARRHERAGCPVGLGARPGHPLLGPRRRIPGATSRHPGLRLPRRPGARRAPRRAGRPAVLAGRSRAHHPLPVHHAAAADAWPAVVHPVLRAADPGPW